jgi:dihydroxycyclohexadiene carboxylate dehydrogenase
LADNPKYTASPLDEPAVDRLEERVNFSFGQPEVARTTAVALVDRSVLVDEVCAEIEAPGGTAVTVTADLETYAGALAAMRATQERFGRINLLVNNVGGTI